MARPWTLCGLVAAALLTGAPAADAATPTITGFTPASGPAGTVISIAGTALTGATRVTIGGRPAAYSVPDANRILATVPPPPRAASCR